MAAILGLRGVGDFTSDERPKNWREAILYLFPNGEAALTAIMSKLRSQGTDDYDFSWWEKKLPTQRLILNGSHAAGATALTVDSGAKDCVKGTVLFVEASGELIRVDADPTTDTSLPTVLRSYGTIAAATMADDAAITVITNVHDQGATAPTAKAYAPTKKNNFTQIFRMPLYLTRTARRTKLRWDNKGPYREAKREALSLHSIEMEKSYLFGDAVDVAGYNGQRQTMTMGVYSWLTTNKGGKFAVNGLLDEDTLDSLIEDIFRYGHNEKLALAGSTFIRAITTLGKRNGIVNMVPSDRVYGMKIVEYTTAFGTLYLKNHPLLSQHPDWRKDAFVLDIQNMLRRTVDDTMFIKDRQARDEDASKDEFLEESGLELQFEETHGYIEGVEGALIT